MKIKIFNKWLKKSNKAEHKTGFWKRTIAGALACILLSGSISMILSTVAYAYDTVPGGQLKLESGICYNGKDPNHPFTYSTNDMPLYYDTMSNQFPYLRGNDGAGGSIGGTTTIVQKRINTGQGWSSVPLYRVSRSGGHSDNLIAATGDKTDIVNALQIKDAVNSLSGINRTINVDEAIMISKVLQNGFKAGWADTHATGYDYTWDENSRYIATQVLIWEIQEGKRWSFADGHYRQEADTVGGNPYYWRDWYNNLWANTGYGTNWYEQILSMCRAQEAPLSVTNGNMGQNVTATKYQADTGTIKAGYLESSDKYQASFYVADPALRGDMAGQYRESSFQWLPDAGSASANLAWSGGVGYLTSNYAGDSGFSGWIKITQNRDEYNDVGYMQGGSSNAWRGFLFGGNRAEYSVWLRVECIGNNRIKVKFVDSDTGTPVNANWTFNTNGIGDDFTENSSGKNFIPAYWANGNNNANYTITVNSVPSDYYIPLQNWTSFNYPGYVLKWGEGGTGWGECDYGKSGASFDGNTVTIHVQRKKPINVKFVDANTGQPVKVDWEFIEQVDGKTISENSSDKSFIPKYYERERWQANNEILVKGVPDGYMMPVKTDTPFVYDTWGSIVKWGTGGTGWVGSTSNGLWKDGDYSKSNSSFSGNTVTIKVQPNDYINVKFIDANTNQPLSVDWSFVVGETSNVTEFKENSNGKSFVPKNQVSENYCIKLDSIPEGYILPANTSTWFNYAGNVLKWGAGGTGWGECDYTAAGASFNGNTITIKIKQTGYVFKYVDGETGKPLDVSFNVDSWQPFVNTWSKVLSFENTSKYETEASGLFTLMPFQLELTGVPKGYEMPTEKAVTFFVQNGEFVLGYNPLDTKNPTKYSNVEYNDKTKTVTIKLYEKVDYVSPCRIVFVDEWDNELGDIKYDLYFQQVDDPYILENGIRQNGKLISAANYGFTDLRMHYFIVPTFLEYCEENIPESIQTVEFAFGETKPRLFNSTEDTWVSEDIIYIRVAFDEPEEPEPPVIDDNLQVDFIQPNSDYHYGEEVVSSFYVKNLSEKNYNPTTSTIDLKMRIEKLDGSQWGEFYSETKNEIIVPANGTQLAYFKWKVPNLLLSTGREQYRIVSIVSVGGSQISTSTSEVKIGSFVNSVTPPAKFDLDGGKYFVMTNPIVKNQDYHNSASWQQYEWIGDNYVVKTYSSKLWTKSITLFPDETNPTVDFNLITRSYVSRSGYSLKVRLIPRIEQYDISDGALTPIVENEQITAVQRAIAYFPENRYSDEAEKYDTLELIEESTFSFKVFEDSTYEVGEKGDGRKHFVPMWYPDGDYVVQCVASSCWSPAGMLNYTDESNKIMINGSLYDDWYSSGKDKN